MRTQNHILLFVFVLLPIVGLTQTLELSTSQSEEESITLLKKASQVVIEGEFQSSNDYFIPLTITILHKDDGSGAEVSNNDVLELFCEVIENYAQYDINLYIDTIRHINNSGLFNSNSPAMLDFLLSAENTINIYFLGWDSNFPVCAVYTPVHDVIAFYGNGCLQADRTTKFFGYQFGLLSTYHGIFDGGDNCGAQLDNGEKVDGSNCDIAGDLICDTPPDYTTLPWECDFNEEGCIQIDPDGVEFKPNGTNFMSASNCRSRFSPMQVETMKYTIDSSLQYLSVLPVPSNLLEITADAILLSPEDEANDIFYQDILFSWEPVENATHYLIEINRLSNFSPSFMVTNTIVATNEYTNSDLLPDLTYYWRIKPYNPGYLCAPYSEVGSFTTTVETSIESIDGLQSFQIYPNPTIAGESIGIALQSDKYLESILSLHNVQGQVVYSNAIATNGTNRYEIQTEGLPVGLYVVNIDFSNAANIQRKALIISQ